MILTGGFVAAAVPFAALVGLHVVQGPEGHNDPSSPVPERSSGALVKAGALCGGRLFGVRRAPAPSPAEEWRGKRVDEGVHFLNDVGVTSHCWQYGAPPGPTL